jgi:hypothetical protein
MSGISTIVQCWPINKLHNHENQAATGRRNGPGRLDSRRTAASRTAYRTRNPQISHVTPRGALFPLGYGHAVRRKRAQGMGLKANSAKSDIHQLDRISANIPTWVNGPGSAPRGARVVGCTALYYVTVHCAARSNRAVTGMGRSASTAAPCPVRPTVSILPGIKSLHAEKAQQNGVRRSSCATRPPRKRI